MTEINIGDVVTYEPARKPNLAPYTEWLGRRFIVTGANPGVSTRVLAVSLDDSQTRLSERVTDFRVLEHATYMKAQDPLPTTMGSVISIADGDDDVMAMLRDTGKWIGANGGQWDCPVDFTVQWVAP